MRKPEPAPRPAPAKHRPLAPAPRPRVGRGEPSCRLRLQPDGPRKRSSNSAWPEAPRWPIQRNRTNRRHNDWLRYLPVASGRVGSLGKRWLESSRVGPFWAPLAARRPLLCRTGNSNLQIWRRVFVYSRSVRRAACLSLQLDLCVHFETCHVVYYLPNS